MPNGPTDEMHPLLKMTGVAIAETVGTNSLLGPDLEPGFTHGIMNGLAQPHKVRGRKGTVYKAEDMINPQD